MVKNKFINYQNLKLYSAIILIIYYGCLLSTNYYLLNPTQIQLSVFLLTVILFLYDFKKKSEESDNHDIKKIIIFFSIITQIVFIIFKFGLNDFIINGIAILMMLIFLIIYFKQ